MVSGVNYIHRWVNSLFLSLLSVSLCVFLFVSPLPPLSVCVCKSLEDKLGDDSCALPPQYQ